MLRIAFVALLLISTPAFAGPMPPQGVWHGTIGTKAIIACFNKGSKWTSYASYYYVRHLTPIPLTTREKGPYWHEGNDTGLWELSAPANGVVTGTWINPKNHKTLPIKLDYVDGRDDDAACSRDSYNSRIEATPEVEKSKIIQFSPGRSYRKLRFAGQETIELIGPGPAVKRINSHLKLDKSKQAIDEYFQQRREFLGRVGYPAVDERLTEPTYWDANFITVRFYEWAAGTGRNGISNTYRTWSTRTGEEIDLWEWLGSSSSYSGLPPKLKRYLFKNVKESSECAYGYRGEGVYTLTLDKAGLHLDEEAWGDGCEKSFFVPYAKLLPFLSPAGKQAVRSIMKEK